MNISPAQILFLKKATMTIRDHAQDRSVITEQCDTITNILNEVTEHGN